jgi:predicted PurR-regulated permease PerM
MLLSVLTHIISFASSALDIIIGLMIMVYILIDKEKIIALGKRVLYIWFSDAQVKNIVNTVKNTNNVFNSFFIGKTLDSIIIGLLFFIGALILDLPYSMLFALIIGLTNMIPYFGPFIGAIPVTALTVLDSPIKGLWVLIFIIILQQFDGIILGPKILGNSTGLKPIGVIFAIIVGGAIAGPLGMFFGVPIFSVALTALMNFIDKNYKEKTAHLNPIVETEAENENTKAS